MQFHWKKRKKKSDVAPFKGHGTLIFFKNICKISFKLICTQSSIIFKKLKNMLHINKKKCYATHKKSRTFRNQEESFWKKNNTNIESEVMSNSILFLKLK